MRRYAGARQTPVRLGRELCRTGRSDSSIEAALLRPAITWQWYLARSVAKRGPASCAVLGRQRQRHRESRTPTRPGAVALQRAAMQADQCKRKRKPDSEPTLVAAAGFR